MKITNLSKILPLAALLLAGVAQPNHAQAQTNAELALNIDLTAVSQGTATTNRDGTVTDLQYTRITSMGIIQVLGTALTNTFSHRAQLVVLAPTNSLDNWTIQIHDGTNTAVDVTGFFVHQPGSNSVSGAWTNKRTGQSGITDYSVDTFSLQDQNGFPALTEHFSVSGFTALNSAMVLNRKGTVVGQAGNISAQVSGTGDSQGTPTLVTGSITADGFDNETASSTTTPGS
jgi:hypothetical protein